MLQLSYPLKYLPKLLILEVVKSTLIVGRWTRVRRINEQVDIGHFYRTVIHETPLHQNIFRYLVRFIITSLRTTTSSGLFILGFSVLWFLFATQSFCRNFANNSRI